MASPDISTLPRDSMSVGCGDGGAGAVKELAVYGRTRVCEWLRVYSRVVAMLPRVEALAAAGRARLEAVNALQHEFWEARDALLQHRLLQAEESRRRWEAAYIELQPSGDDRKFAELQESDFEDLTTFVDVLAAENTEFQIKLKEVEGGMDHSQNAADHENITRDLKAELLKLKQAYEAVCSEKDKEVSQITAERDFVRDRFKTLEWDYADLRSSYLKKGATRATEAAQELQQKVEQLQVASRKKDDEIHRLRAQAKAKAKAKAAETKRKLVRESKLPEVGCMPEKIGGETEKHKGKQSETNQLPKKDMSEMQKKYCSEGPALRGETKKCPSKKMLAAGQPETNQKRKCVTFLSDNDGKNRNDEETREQVLEPLTKKRTLGKKVVEQEDNKTELVNGKGQDVGSQLALYNSLLYLRAVTDSFSDNPEKHKEFLAVQRELVSRKIGVDAFISAVKVLLYGHPELIRGFKSCFTCTPTQVLGSTDTKC